MLKPCSKATFLHTRMLIGVSVLATIIIYWQITNPSVRIKALLDINNRETHDTAERTCNKLKNPTDSYTQLTFLSHGAPPLSNQIKFPCYHMPPLQVDSRKIFAGKAEVLELEGIVGYIIKVKPGWRHLRRHQINLMIDKVKQENASSELVSKMVKFHNYTKLSTFSHRLGMILVQIGILKQRKFPDKRRTLTCDKCFPYDFKHMITPKGVCKNSTTVTFVAIATTIPQHTHVRMNIRTKLWGTEDNKKKYNFKVIFLLGGGWPQNQIDAVREENNKYNDILMDDFIDNYYNLTQKVLMGYRWVLKECPQAEFVIRGADDTNINIPKLVNLLKENGHYETFQNHQVGHCYPKYVPERSPGFKGYLSTLEYDQNLFPPYALGTTFITSSKLTKEIVDISPNVPYISIEDSYLGLVLAQLGRGCHHVKGMDRGIISHRPVHR